MESANAPQLLTARLLFAHKPELRPTHVAAQLRKSFAQVDHSDGSLVFFFPEYAAQYADGKQVPASVMVTEAQKITASDDFTAALQQSWHWNNAAETIAACHFEVVVTDFMSRALEYQRRIELFQKVVDALLRELRPQAVYFPSSQKVMEPQAHLACGEAVLDGLLNVRFYNVAGSETQEMLMDTLGLHAFGLPDFQLRFAEQEPGSVAGALTGYAYYVFENGPVIDDGNTIQGLTPHDKWTCYYADASVGPEREVIDLATA